MNTLLIDAGNTRLKWAIYAQGQFLQRGVFTYEWLALQEQFGVQWASQINAGKIDKLVLCNVAGERLETPLRQWLSDNRAQGTALQEKRPLTIVNLAAQSQAFGVRCAYEQPGQLGSDRWAALVAARHHITGPCCVIDCGTALTIDLLSADGIHEGGLIAPGMTMMRQSLLENTVQIDVDAAESKSVFSVHDTASAVQAGIMAATEGTVQQVLQQASGQWQRVPVCVVTGGNAHAILSILPRGSMHEAEWVLKGLAVIADRDV